MNKAGYALAFLGLCLLITLGYDGYLFLSGGTEATISWMIYEMAYDKPIFVSLISWFIGLMQGHLFWQMKRPND